MPSSKIITPGHSEYGEWESELLAWKHPRANYPYEPYSGIALLFNGDAKLMEGGDVRADWQVVGSYALKFDPVDSEQYKVD